VEIGDNLKDVDYLTEYFLKNYFPFHITRYVREEELDWLNENLNQSLSNRFWRVQNIDAVWDHSNDTVYFKNEADAILFKLTWY